MINFKKLTNRQLEVFESIAVNQDLCHPQRVLSSLEKKGMIESESVILPGYPPVRVRRYFVPVPVHFAWCEWCASLPDSEIWD